ncbi:MAG TPA: hemolysin family protein [Aggregatilinea sp.]|uniref:hemolysin family protein n=1 Tax=Aggregatilinea sp. TaxID=2806333 RepID=UPI002CC8727E|nr:hemolysin family protein [Aggregatilinea sp.]HML24876.1 hemolysin family protein [Aggregatilinea sp.]
MPSAVFEIGILAILILFNGLFALSEMSIVSARKARLQQWANEGSSQAGVALELAEDPNAFLSTIQVGITLIGTLSGAVGGQTLSRTLSRQIEEIEPLAPYSGALGFGIVVALITYASLVIGELVPKRLALQNPERAATLVARPMRSLSRIAFPLVRLLSASNNAVLRVLGVKPSRNAPITEDEIRLLVAQGAEAGVFEAAEQDMVESVFQLDDRPVRSLMTPHTEIVWLDVTDSPEETQRKIAECPHSTFPVCEGGLDHVLGVVRAKALLNQALSGAALDLHALVRPAPFVPENAAANDALDLFRRAGESLALVIDEHGSIQGYVTEHDLLEAIVGVLPSAEFGGEPEITQREDGSWLVDGLAQIETVKELIGAYALPDENRSAYQTLGGFVMDQIDAIPSAGQHFSWNGFRFEVMDMDGLRVDKVLIAREADAEAADGAAQEPE